MAGDIHFAGITMASSKTRKPPNAFNFLRQNDVLKKAGLDDGFDAPWPVTFGLCTLTCCADGSSCQS